MEKTYYLETRAGVYLGLAAEGAACRAETAPVVEKCRDLMGNLHAWTLGYEHRLSLGPLYACPGDSLYRHLKKLLSRGLVMDRLRTSLVEVSPDGTALRREACMEITGAAEERLSFCLHFTGRCLPGRFEGGRFFC